MKKYRKGKKNQTDKVNHQLDLGSKSVMILGDQLLRIHSTASE